MVAFVGKYFYDKSEGLEEFLKKLAGPAGVEAAKFFKQNKPVFEVSHSDDEYIFVFSSGDKKITNSFKLDFEFDETMFYDFVLKVINYCIQIIMAY